MNVSSLRRFRWLRLRGVSRARALLAVSALAALAASTQSLAQPNLLVAGDFEGISNPLGGYAQQVSAGVWGTESGAVTGAANGITPLGSQMLQMNHSGGGSSAQTNQIVKGPFKAGSVVTFSVKFNSWLTSSSIAPFPLQVAVSVGNAVLDSNPGTDNRSGPAVSSAVVLLDTDRSSWQTATVTTTLTSDTDYLAAELFVKMNTGGPTGTPLAYADDAVLTVVPPTPPIHWVNWKTFETVGGVTKYVGEMVVPRTGGGSTTVTVKYTPPGGIKFFQASTGTDYWTQGQGGALGRNPARSPYTSAKVPNIPDGGGAAGDKTDIIGLQFAGTNKLEFTDASNGQPISIASPVFAYVSLNGNGYGFDQDFDILSFGDGTVRDQGFFGPGTSFKSVATVNGATQYQLLGTGEPHGTLQFRGSFSTVTWQSLSSEDWNGFTIGVASLADDVPIANAGPDQTLDATSASGATVQLAGSVSGSTKAPFSYSWTGDFGTVTGASPSVTLGVGTHTITLVVTDAAGASDSDDVVITIKPNPAPVITSPTNAGGTYGSAFTYTITATNAPTGFGATDLPPGLTFSGAVISGTPTQAGLFSVKLSAQNSGGTGNGSVLLNIAKANATIVVTPYSVTYDGNEHSATVTSITGVNGETGASVGTVTLNSTHTDAGTYTDSWSFTATPNYNSIGSQTITDTIAKADATVVVNGYSGIYDGTAHGATGFATGISRDVDLSAGLSLGASFTNAPGGTATWSFSGGRNYNDSHGSVAIDIAKADARLAVNGYTGTYDGAAHGASGSATGVGGADLSAGLNFGATFTNAPGGTANWTFTGGINYNDSHGSVAIDIAKADATVVVTPYSVTYDGNAHSATVTSITGVNGETGATVGSVTLNTTHTNADTYSDSWSFSGTGNYNDIAAKTITDMIAKANAVVAVTGYNVTYDGNAHTATGAATGVKGESLGGLDLSATTHTGAGNTNDTWTFTDSTGNYNNATGSVADAIAKANATVTVTGYSVTYDSTSHTATGSVTGVKGEALSGLNLGATTRTNAGTTSDTWTFTDSTGNYNNATGTVTDVIAKANPTIAVLGYNVTYDGNSHTATGSAVGVKGEPLNGLSLAATTHTNAGIMTDTWAFTDSTGNYHNAAGTVTDAIAKANATITVSGYNVIYDGQSHTATGSAVGVKGESLSGLDLAATTHTNTGSTTDAWAFTDITGNYNNASGSVADAIAQAATKTTLSAAPTVQAVGQPVTLTATVSTVTPVVGSPNGTVTFTMGSTVLGTATLNASGVATLPTTALPLGPQSITATYSGAANFVASASSAASVLIYGYPTGGGTFVIGDGNTAVGATVNFWGAQWEKTNSLTGGASNASFKGLATGPVPPLVGGTFKAAPGNSGPPPASVPGYLGVIVTSKVTKSGSNVTGTIVKLVVVKTAPGYAGDPGNAGTGTIVAVIP